MGVFPGGPHIIAHIKRLPHARGGVSHDRALDRWLEESSPRPWGCFQLGHVDRLLGGVFPTPVGVFLIKKDPTVGDNGLPHARGGVSIKRLRQRL